ncbi:MAG: hypothetical protein R6U39_05250 [Candidatus Aegiribacteria sp.]
MAFHALGGILLFIAWRMTGMPSPGVLGRLIPLAWLITAVVYGRGDRPAASLQLLGISLLLFVFWAAAPGMFTVASSSAMLAVFPGLMKVSRRRLGLLMAVIPLVPMILVLVPFTGDEPHYARITEELFPGGTGRFQEYQRQAGDPGEGFRHHQSLYPALMLPGYPGGITGIRLMNTLFALWAVTVLSRTMRKSGFRKWRELPLLALLTMPGSGVLGLVYPGWLAVAVFVTGVYMFLKGGRKVWVLAAAGALVLVKIRFAGLSLGLLLALLLEYRGRKRLTIALVLLSVAAAGLLFDFGFLGGRVFWVRYGNVEFLKTVLVQPLYRSSHLLLALFSTLVDIESGLLWKAPWVLAGLAGLPALRRERRALFRWLGLPGLLYLLVLVYWTGTNWSGMPTPAGRMLLPLLPILLASLGMVMKRAGVRVLVWISMAAGAVYYCHPLLRMNHADGTDALASTLAGAAGSLAAWVPSAVRFSLPVFLFWILGSALVVWMIAARRGGTGYVLAAGFALLCLAGGTTRTRWEAEDIPPSMKDFCQLYPRETEPEHRKFWMFSTQRMLRLHREEDAVRIPVRRDPGDVAAVEITYRSMGEGRGPGIRLTCGGWSDSLFSVSDMLDPPDWTTRIREAGLEKRPENLGELRWTLEMPVTADTLLIEVIPAAGPDDDLHGIYLDAVTVR